MTGDRPIRVLVVDDHAVVRRGVVAYLEALEDLEVAGEAGNGQETLDFLSRASAHRELPDVVLMDLQMPGMDGVTATGEVVRRFPEVRVVILTSFGETERVHAALEQGASGYLLKDAEADDVISGVRAVSRGESPIHPRAARELLGARQTVPTLIDLTPRELEVLELVRAGLANKQIARRLGISERTVKAHLTSVFSRIGVVDRTQAALWAERRGIGDAPA